MIIVDRYHPLNVPQSPQMETRHLLAVVRKERKRCEELLARDELEKDTARIALETALQESLAKKQPLDDKFTFHGGGSLYLYIPTW